MGTTTVRVSLCRNFISAGTIDDPASYVGVLSGILCIAKESIFSRLDNLSGLAPDSRSRETLASRRRIGASSPKREI